jgi:hypothetical protein
MNQGGQGMTMMDQGGQGMTTTVKDGKVEKG